MAVNYASEGGSQHLLPAGPPRGLAAPLVNHSTHVVPCSEHSAIQTRESSHSLALPQLHPEMSTWIGVTVHDTALPSVNDTHPITITGGIPPEKRRPTGTSSHSDARVIDKRCMMQRPCRHASSCMRHPHCKFIAMYAILYSARCPWRAPAGVGPTHLLHPAACSLLASYQ